MRCFPSKAGHSFGLRQPGAFFYPFYAFLEILNFLFDAFRPMRGTLQAAGTDFFAWELFYPFYVFLKILLFPFDALGPRGGPYFLLLQKVGKDRRKGVSPPCGSPDQSGVLDAPLWKPPSLRWRGRPGRTPRRFAAGASVLLGKAASACALASAAAPPPLRLGASPPCPPRFPIGKRLLVMRACWGLRPLAPTFPKGKSLPLMRASAWDRVRNGFCGNAFANLPEAPAA